MSGNQATPGRSRQYHSYLTVEEWQRNIAEWAHEKGWWEGFPGSRVAVSIAIQRESQSHGEKMRCTLGQQQSNYIAAKLALVHSEVSEALEALRDGDMALRYDEEGKPEGLESELVDVIIRVLDLGSALGMNLGAAMSQKMAYNERRKPKHGGKAL